MPDIKERPKAGGPKSVAPKTRNQAGHNQHPKEIGAQMKERYVRELIKEKDGGEQDAGEYATEQVELTADHAVRRAGSSVQRGASHVRQQIKTRQEKREKAERNSTAPDAQERPGGAFKDNRPEAREAGHYSGEPQEYARQSRLFDPSDIPPNESQPVYSAPRTASPASSYQATENTATEYYPADRRPVTGNTARPEVASQSPQAPQALRQAEAPAQGNMLPFSHGEIAEPQRRLWIEKSQSAKAAKTTQNMESAYQHLVENVSQIETHFDIPASAPVEHTGIDISQQHFKHTPAPSTESMESSRGHTQGRLNIKERQVSARQPKTKPISAPKTVNRAQNIKTASAAPVKASSQVKIKTAAAPRRAATLAERRGRQKAVMELSQKSVKAAKKTVKAGAHAVKAIGKGVSKGISMIIAAGGGGVVLVLLIFVAVIGAISASPFGLFFAGRDGQINTTPTVTVPEAVASVQIDFNRQLENLQSGEYDDITIEGSPPDWPEVLAVFAAKTAGADTGVDVATMDAQRVEILKSVFWDMCTLSSEVDEIEHAGDEGEEGTTEYNLKITITAKTAEDMRTAYTFTEYQNSALDELLSDRPALNELAGDLTINNTDTLALLAALPDDLPEERRAIIQAACQLVGKVTYFWGGKSYVIGWDSRWGDIMKVWAEGSETTGTYRPYGLDCSGFVDWAFYNGTGGAYYPGQGGGTNTQYANSYAITWDEAIPGDLVFYSDISHVGIVGGRDADGNLRIIHCTSGSINCVTITGVSGFGLIVRPFYFSN